MANTSIPSKMTAVMIERPGGPEVLKPAEMETPKPGAGQVLVKVAAAGVNRPDALQRIGIYPAPPGAPSWPGLEVAGRIVAARPERHAPAGGRARDGARRRRRLRHLLRRRRSARHSDPRSDDRDRSRGRARDLLHRVGQCLHARQAQSRRKHSYSRRLLRHRHHGHSALQGVRRARLHDRRQRNQMQGVHGSRRDVAINYKTEDFAERVKAETDGRGVDMVLDMVGGDYIAEEYRLPGRERPPCLRSRFSAGRRPKSISRR